MIEKIVNAIKGIDTYTTILLVVFTGLFTLLYEGSKHKKRGEDREVKIIKVISYSYLALGIIMFALLLMK
ncbi:MAG: hypothetical protein M0Q14_06050 [Tissierellaceae bacterium]|nr:hypothetical protein [Tissierellaceae bacterium]